MKKFRKFGGVNKHLKRENSIIVDLFLGQFKNTISCNLCHQVCISFD